MKYLKTTKIAALAVLLLTILSCSTEPIIGSTVTYFPEIALNGASTVFVPLGATYNDPGVIATVNGATVEYTSTTIGVNRKSPKLDTSIQDEYIQTYKAVNSDGFPNTVTRRVIVHKTGDLINSIEGVYTSTVARNGSTPSDAYRNMKYIYIWKNTDGTYEISDAFGGWYPIGRAIADSNTPGGRMSAVNISTNNFTFPGNPMTNSYFGGVATLTAVTVDPATKKVIVACDWTTGTSQFKFASTLTQVQL